MSDRWGEPGASPSDLPPLQFEPPEGCLHPGCDAPAEVVMEWTWRSSGGITPGARLQCAASHWYTWVGPEIADPFVG